MRISLPIDVWDPARGGAERYLDRLARELALRGHEVTILCLEAADGGVHPAGGAGGPRIELLRAPRFPRWLREIAFAREALRAHRRSGRDILFAVRHALEADVYQPHGGSLRAAREGAGLALPRWRRATRDAFAFLRPSLRVLLWLDREVFARSPALITISVSSKVEADFRRAYPGVPFRFERLPNPVDGERFHDRDRPEREASLRARLGAPEGERIAVFAAHRFRPKGLFPALRAISAAPGWSLVVAGRGRTAPFRAAAARLGLAARVHFAGPAADPRELYAGAHALLLPTYYDPCSLAVLEAMACGAPAVTTRANGASELIEEGVSGYTVDHPGDAAAIGRALRAIGEGWRGFHDAALRAASRWGWDLHLDRMENILFRALRRD